MKKKRPKPGEIYAYYIKELEKYGACQIVGLTDKSACYVSLDCLTDHLPDKDEILNCKPVFMERYRYHHSMDTAWINLTPPPPSYHCLGEFPLVTDKMSTSFSGVWPNGSTYISENYWKSLSEEVKSAYKKYMTGGENVLIHGKTFRKGQPILTNDLYNHLNERDSLVQFPCILSAQVEGFSDKLPKLIKSAPLLNKLKLKNPGAAVMDLRGTGLEDLELDMTGVAKLYLPEKVRRLFLYGDIERELIIDGSICEKKVPPLFLVISLKKAQVSRFGMERSRVGALFLIDIAEVDAAEIVECFPDLETLCMTGCPGVTKNIQMLGQLSKLQELSVRDLFGFDTEFLEGITQMTKLRELDCESIPKDVGTEIKKRWKGKIDVLSVTKLRDENWLKENIDNPLRHWDGSEFIPQAAYKKAFQCYKNTKKKLLEAADRQEIIRIVQEYTEEFNKLNKKYEEFIETEERDDIFEAMKQLYEDRVVRQFADDENVTGNGLDISWEEIENVMEELREDW